MIKQMQEKAPSQVLGFFGGPVPAPDVRVKRVPVDSAQLPERRCLALGRKQHHGPPSCAKSVGDVSERAFVRLQGSPKKQGTLSRATQI